jgi:hypothetical protein
MEHRRHIVITDGFPKETGITVPHDLGRFLHVPQVADIVQEFDSSTVSKGPSSVEVVPPLESSRLEELGQKLVSLALSLDSSAPIDHKIVKIPSNMTVWDKRHFSGKYNERLQDDDFPKD